MKTTIHKDHIRLQAETKKESQALSELLCWIWQNKGVIEAVPENIANNHGCRKVGNDHLTFVSLPREQCEALDEEPITPEQALNNFRLLLELSPDNTYQEYRSAVQEIASCMIERGIKGA